MTERRIERKPLRLVLMGVSGSGKSSIGAALSARIKVPFLDGDDLHPAANRAKMAAGVALRDADRWPWLDLIAARLAQRAPLIVACSALRRSYRDRLRAGAGGPVGFVYLCGTPALLRARLAARRGHFFPAALLDSQLATLEPPGLDGSEGLPGPDESPLLVLDIEAPVETLAGRIADWLAGQGMFP